MSATPSTTFVNNHLSPSTPQTKSTGVGRNRRSPKGTRAPGRTMETEASRIRIIDRENPRLRAELGNVVNAFGLSVRVKTQRDVLTTAIDLLRHCLAEHTERTDEENAPPNAAETPNILHRKRARHYVKHVSSSSAVAATTSMPPTYTTAVDYESIIKDLRGQVATLKHETAIFRERIDDVNIAPPPIDSVHSQELASTKRTTVTYRRYNHYDYARSYQLETVHYITSVTYAVKPIERIVAELQQRDYTVTNDNRMHIITGGPSDAVIPANEHRFILQNTLCRMDSDVANKLRGKTDVDPFDIWLYLYSGR